MTREAQINCSYAEEGTWQRFTLMLKEKGFNHSSGDLSDQESTVWVEGRCFPTSIFRIGSVERFVAFLLLRNSTEYHAVRGFSSILRRPQGDPLEFDATGDGEFPGAL
jgi:hypothetical protein